jgi:hypothetical protein
MTPARYVVVCTTGDGSPAFFPVLIESYGEDDLSTATAVAKAAGYAEPFIIFGELDNVPWLIAHFDWNDVSRLRMASQTEDGHAQDAS